MVSGFALRTSIETALFKFDVFFLELYGSPGLLTIMFFLLFGLLALDRLSVEELSFFCVGVAGVVVLGVESFRRDSA